MFIYIGAYTYLCVINNVLFSTFYLNKYIVFHQMCLVVDCLNPEALSRLKSKRLAILPRKTGSKYVKNFLENT
ncbi:hypothetical protein [Calothrix anomala]|uniref:hypothetical protein n=1 Tax=Calothrix anomala TaxID=212351 RepID=UPI0030D7108D